MVPGNSSFLACVPTFTSILKGPSFLLSSFVLGCLVSMYFQSSQVSSFFSDNGVSLLLRLYWTACAFYDFFNSPAAFSCALVSSFRYSLAAGTQSALLELILCCGWWP